MIILLNYGIVEMEYNKISYSFQTCLQEINDHKPDLFLDGGTLCEYFSCYAKEYTLQIPLIEVKLQAFLYNRDRDMMGLPTLWTLLHHFLNVNMNV